MPRFSLLGWWCSACGQKNSPDARKCSKCKANHHEKYAQVREFERAVIYYNPATGERRTPARNDQPLPETYASQGFERREILSMSAYEKEAGVVHEATSFSPGNEPNPENLKTPTMPKELKESLIEDMRDAMASGPWTLGGESLTQALSHPDIPE